MTSRLLEISLAVATLAVLLLVVTDAALVATVLLNSDKVEVMHDQLIISESKLESRTEDYNRLLEKVGGSDLPKVPYTPVRPGKAR